MGSGCKTHVLNRYRFFNSGVFSHSGWAFSSGKSVLMVSPEPLRDLYERLVPYWCSNHRGTLSMDHADPGRKHVELRVDGFASANDQTVARTVGLVKRVTA
jgi:hypothetical protein